ncbi:MAG: hypothetical protein HOJ80_10865 [Halieaceae bacterium]|nr:hypothetical protein [Halieaceae bacterium]
MNLNIALLSFILTFCISPSWAEVTPTLNSDAIKATFGSYGVTILNQTESTRVANLYSGHSGREICRTLAVTEFVLPMDPKLSLEHEKIRAGGSIGATLRDAGFSINKKLIIKTEIVAGPAFSQLSNQTVEPGAPLATRVYALFAQSSERAIPYAIIAEAYHPAHQPPTHEEVSDAPALTAAADRALSALRTAIDLSLMKSPAA